MIYGSQPLSIFRRMILGIFASLLAIHAFASTGDTYASNGAMYDDSTNGIIGGDVEGIIGGDINENGIGSFPLVLVAPIEHVHVNGSFDALGQHVFVIAGTRVFSVPHRTWHPQPGAMVAVNGVLIGSGVIVASVVRSLSATNVPGATNLYLRGSIDHVDRAIGHARIGNLSVDYTQAMFNLAFSELRNHSIVELSGLQPVAKAMFVALSGEPVADSIDTSKLGLKSVELTIDRVHGARLGEIAASDLNGIIGGDKDGIIGGDKDGIIGGDKDGIIGGDKDGIIGGDKDGIIGGDKDGIIGGDKDGIIGGDKDGIIGGDKDGIIGGDKSGAHTER